MIVRLRVARLVEAKDRVHEVRAPPEEERQHEPVTELESVIDRDTMLGGVGQKAHELVKDRQVESHSKKENLDWADVFAVHVHRMSEFRMRRQRRAGSMPKAEGDGTNPGKYHSEDTEHEKDRAIQSRARGRIGPHARKTGLRGIHPVKGKTSHKQKGLTGKRRRLHVMILRAFLRNQMP
jgi:hypothetical protein